MSEDVRGHVWPLESGGGVGCSVLHHDVGLFLREEGEGVHLGCEEMRENQWCCVSMCTWLYESRDVLKRVGM